MWYRSFYQEVSAVIKDLSLLQYSYFNDVIPTVSEWSANAITSTAISTVNSNDENSLKNMNSATETAVMKVLNAIEYELSNLTWPNDRLIGRLVRMTSPA
jgi:hypothetical protein